MPNCPTAAIWRCTSAELSERIAAVAALAATVSDPGAGSTLTVNKSGAIAMNPSAASWSATPRTHPDNPKISCTTTPTGAFLEGSGYTTQARTLSDAPVRIMTYSPWRGDLANRPPTVAAPAG